MADAPTPPPQPDDLEPTEVRTFLIADVRGYTRFTQEHGDEAASQLAARFAAIVREAVTAFNGELLELRGDEALCVFSSARQALRASVELQRALRTTGNDAQAFPLGVGVGLDSGEAVPTEGGYRGRALNVAARLCSLAAGGEVLASERVVGLASRVNGLHWVNRKPMRLKGMPEPERVVEVKPDEALPPAPAPPPAPARAMPRRKVLAIALALLIAVIAVAGALSNRGDGDEAAGVPTRENSLAAIDPQQGRVVSDTLLQSMPESIAAGYGSIWVGLADGTVQEVSIATLDTRGKGVLIDPAFLAAGAGGVWVFDGKSQIAEVEPRTMEVVTPPHKLWPCQSQPLNPGHSGCAGGGIAIVGHEVWVGRARDKFYGSHNGELVRLSGTTGTPVGTVPHVAIGTLAEDQGNVWSYGDLGRELDLVPAGTHAVTLRVPLLQGRPSLQPVSLAIGSGYAWANVPSGVLYRVDPSTPSPFTYSVPPGASGIVDAYGSLWIARGGGVVQINPFNGHVMHTYAMGNGSPAALTAANGRIWVALG